MPSGKALWQTLPKIPKPPVMLFWGSELSVIQPWFYSNYFCNCAALSKVLLLCLLVVFAPHSLGLLLPCWGSFQTTAAMPPTSPPTMSTDSSKQVVWFDLSYTRMWESAGWCSLQLRDASKEAAPTQGRLNPACFDFEGLITLFIKFLSFWCPGKQSQ